MKSRNRRNARPNKPKPSAHFWLGVARAFNPRARLRDDPYPELHAGSIAEDGARVAGDFWTVLGRDPVGPERA